jgi:hypothetical protein
MQISMNGYSTIYSNLQEAKQNLITGDYGFTGELRRGFAEHKSDSSNITKVSTNDFEKKTGLTDSDITALKDKMKGIAAGNYEPGIKFSGITDVTNDWKSYQKDICNITDTVSQLSGLGHNLSLDLGLDQSFSSINDLENAIDRACLDVKA